MQLDIVETAGKTPGSSSQDKQKKIELLPAGKKLLKEKVQ